MDLESKYSALSQRTDEVVTFENLQQQKKQLEALLAAAVVRLEQLFNASIQATRFKDKVRSRIFRAGFLRIFPIRASL